MNSITVLNQCLNNSETEGYTVLSYRRAWKIVFVLSRGKIYKPHIILETRILYIYTHMHTVEHLFACAQKNIVVSQRGDEKK